MPKKKKYQAELPSRILKLEQEELEFQKELNEHDYWTWEKLYSTIDPSKNYKLMVGGMYEVFRGDELLQEVYENIMEGSSSMVDDAVEVPDDYELSPQELWEGELDPKTGKLIVSEPDEDIWDIDTFKNELQDMLESDKLGKPLLDDVVSKNTAKLIKERCKEQNCDDKDIIKEITPIIRDFYGESYQMFKGSGDTRNDAMVGAHMRSSEAFDRAYALARLDKAGIDIKKYPQFNNYQGFYDAGLAPPTHEQMANYLIDTYAKTTKMKRSLPQSIMPPRLDTPSFGSNKRPKPPGFMPRMPGQRRKK